MSRVTHSTATHTGDLPPVDHESPDDPTEGVSAVNGFERKVQWQPRYGIASAHWEQFRSYAHDHQLFILVRGGKDASIPWIERGFPGKPLTLKTKVDPALGLLVARDSYERKQALDAGHLVIARTAAGLQLVGARGAGSALPMSATMHRWAHDGVVVDGMKKLPFTSDYDLAAVFPAKDDDYVGVFGQHTIGGSVTSAYAERVRVDMNRVFGSERICHGPQAQYDQRLANATDKSETIVAFTPTREVCAVRTPDSVGWQTVQFRDIAIAIYPEKAARFKN
jgi:hypothetical protein